MDGLALFLPLWVGLTDPRYPNEDRRSILINAAAGVLGVSRRTVYYHIQAGRLQTIRTRGGSQRVLWSSIESWLRAAGGGEEAPQGG